MQQAHVNADVKKAVRYSGISADRATRRRASSSTGTPTSRMMMSFGVGSSDDKHSKLSGSRLEKSVAGAVNGKVTRTIKKYAKVLNQDFARTDLAGNEAMSANGKIGRIDGARQAVQLDRVEGSRSRDGPRRLATERGRGRTKPRRKERPSRPAVPPPPKGQRGETRSASARMEEDTRESSPTL